LVQDNVQETIGSATMERDGTITLHLSVDDPNAGIGDGVITYRRSDPDYDYVLDHIGNLKPGENVAVRPFPDVRR